MKCGCTSNNSGEQKRMLHDINMVSFAVVEMTLYLDTHPCDQDALEYFNHYNRIRNQLMKEYAAKFGPLTVADSVSNNEWKWAMGPMPWEGAYN